MDHCLRSGFYETAIRLARDSQIEVGFLHWSLFHKFTFEANGPLGGNLQYFRLCTIA